MPQPAHDPAHLWDMLEAAGSVIRFVGNTTFDEYLRNEVLQAAVERRIEIIEEAARRVSDEFKESHSEIPRRGIIAQRHFSCSRIWGDKPANLMECDDGEPSGTDRYA